MRIGNAFRDNEKQALTRYVLCIRMEMYDDFTAQLSDRLGDKWSV
jgi:hypothetical protein